MKSKNMPMTLAVFIVTVACSIIATLVNVPPWPIFIGWSLFYLIGANKKSVIENLPSLVGGVILAFLTAALLDYLALSLIPNSLLVGVMAALAILWQDTIFFKMISIVFVGINMYFALGSVFLAIILPAAGFVMGLITNQLILIIDKKQEVK